MFGTKYYPFLDVVLDVYVSIILYNVFIAFTGFNLQAVLLLFVMMVIINYWWNSRQYGELPKHYLIDVYFITAVMFIFSQWPNYFSDITKFLYVTAVFFAVDAVYSATAIYAHGETKDHPSLKFFFATEAALAAAYFGLSFVFTSLTWAAVLTVFLPYLAWTAAGVKRGLFRFKFIDTGNQPY